MQLNTYTITETVILENGAALSNINIAYHTAGNLNADKNSVVWVFHALTANSNPAEWWAGLIGDDKLFDPKNYFIICANMPGSCYGSIHPLSIDPKTEKPYYSNFPCFTSFDMAQCYVYLMQHLGITKIHVGIGGSMGGQQLLAWASVAPNLFEHIIPIATNAQHSPWGIAFNASQRMAIEADSTWLLPEPTAAAKGLAAARSIALLSYRNYDTYQQTQKEHSTHKLEKYNSESYQHYQGQKLVNRFDAYSYYTLTKSMDAHNLARKFESIELALNRIKSKALVIGINTDILFPIAEQATIAKHIPEAKFCAIDSLYGHDGFLLEYEQLTAIIFTFLNKK